jgi:hypothetical protein
MQIDGFPANSILGNSESIRRAEVSNSPRLFSCGVAQHR